MDKSLAAVVSILLFSLTLGTAATLQLPPQETPQPTPAPTATPVAIQQSPSPTLQPSPTQTAPPTPTHTPTPTLTPSPTPKPSPKPMAPTIKKAVYAYGGALTLANAAYAATHFDLVDLESGASWLYPDTTLNALRAAHSDIIILGYQLMTGAYTYGDDWAVVDANEAWFIHDTDGNRVYGVGTDWYLMDMGNAGWRAHWVNYVNTKMAAHPQYDGVFADNAFCSIPTWVTWSMPYSKFSAVDLANWNANCIGFLQYVEANITPGKTLVINSDDQNTLDFFDECDGEMIEGFAHATWEAPTDHSTNTMQLVNLLAGAASQDKVTWYPSGMTFPVGTTQAQIDATVKYCYAAALLSMGGTKSYFGFNDWTSGDSSKGYYSIMDTDIGSPNGSYYMTQNVYARNFTDGIALLNPSATPRTVDLGGTYTTLAGVDVTSVSLAAWAGDVLSGPVHVEPEPIQYYTVNASAGAGGSVVPSGANVIEVGSSFTCTAYPATDHLFSHWDLDGVNVSSASTYIYAGGLPNVTYALVASFTANPPPVQHYHVNISVSPVGGGAANPTGAQQRNVGTSLSVTETPAGGYSFSHWTLNAVVVGNANPIIVSGAADETLTLVAVFVADTPPIQHYHVAISVSGGVGGSTNPSGNQQRNVGTALSVTATASSGFTFSVWTLGGTDYSNNTTVSVSGAADQTLTLIAIFEANPPPPPPPPPPPVTYTVVIPTVTGGDTNKDGTNIINVPNSFSCTASPDPDYVFSYWLRNSVNVGSANPYTFTGTAGSNYTLQPVFTYVPPPPPPPPPAKFTVYVPTVVGGSTDQDGTHDVILPASFIANATADANYVFGNWLLDNVNVGTSDSYNFTGAAGTSYTLQPVFVYVEPPPPAPTTYTVVVPTVTGGTTNKDGTNVVTSPASFTVTATAAANYAFSYWLLNTANVGAANPYTFTGTAGEYYTLQPVFTYVPPTPGPDPAPGASAQFNKVVAKIESVTASPVSRIFDRIEELT